MNGVKRERSARIRDDSAQRRRSAPVEKMEKERVESPVPSSGSGTSNIRTRLSTGTLHMNGTQTFKDIKVNQVSDDSNDSQKMTPAKDIPALQGKKRGGSDITQVPPKRRKIGKNDGSGEGNKNDYFCWVCHKDGNVICCELCPRVFHKRCLDMVTDVPPDWVCPECEKIMRAECVDSRSRAMAMISVDTLCFLLKFALERMKHSGSDPFMNPVDPSSVPHYSDYIFHPMDLGILEKNIKKKMYGCTEAFLADAKWILHNCVIFNGLHNKLTTAAKTIIKICKHEMSEIEVCPDCYLNSCVKRNDEWFCEPCREPHPLVWAKLKGYPFWSAKALREKDGLVDVRFFGAHDRSWVPTSQVFMLSEDIPVAMRNKRTAGFDNAMDETNLHIKKLRDKFGGFEYAPFRTPYDKSKIYSPMKKKKPLVKKPSHHFNVVKRKTIDPKSSVTKTASAVRLKYNSIITTRKAAVSSSVKSPVSTVKADAGSQELPPLEYQTKKTDGQQNQEKTDGNKKHLDESFSKSDIVDSYEEKDVKNVSKEKLNDSILEKDVSSDDDSVNLLEDRVLDSSGSESVTPQKINVVKKDVDLKPQGNVSDSPNSELSEKSCVTEPQTNEATVMDEESESVAMETEDSITKDSQISKDSEKTDADSKRSSEVAECSENDSEPSHLEVSSVLDGRQTPTDSVDGEIVCMAKNGKVSECHRFNKPQTNISAQKEQTINLAKESESADIKCSDNEKDKSTSEPSKDDSDLETSLLMEVDTERDMDKIMSKGDETDMLPVKTVSSIKKSPPKDTSKSKFSPEKKTMKIIPGQKSLGATAFKNIAPKPVVQPTQIIFPASRVNAMYTVTQNSQPEKQTETETIKIVDVVSEAQKSPTESSEPMKVALFRSKKGQAGESSEKRTTTEDTETDETKSAEDKTTTESSPANLVVEKYKTKLLDAMKKTLDDMCTDLVKNAVPDGGSNKHYQQELEKLRWIHLQEVAELKHNFKLTVIEMRSVWDAERQKLFKDVSKMCEKEKNKAIAETKKKQWCAQCGKEAIYYCCWNTSYCTYECQQSQWPEHMPSCMQTLSVSQDQQKTDQSKASTSTAGTKEAVKKGPSPNSKQSEWSEKDEAEQAQRTFNLAPPVTTSPTTTSSSPQTATWRNRARDNLEQVLRRQEDIPQPPQPQAQTVFIPPQLLPGQTPHPTQSFLQGGQPMSIQYIQQVPPNSGPPPPAAVHLPPSSLANFSQPPQVRLQGYPVSQAQGPGAGLFPVLRQQQPHMSNPTPVAMANQGPVPGNYMPRSQIFLAPNAQGPRNTSMPSQMHFQIRHC